MSITSILDSWYPLARSIDLKKGKARSLTLLEHELVLFRSHDNTVGVLRRQCPHMGGDLSRGRVTASGLACPIHHWEFSSDGRRLAGNNPECASSETCQPSIKCIERWGLIFGFLGDKPYFDFPDTQQEVFIAQPVVSDMKMHYTVPSLFGFDTEHFTTVHHREIGKMTIYKNGPGHIGTALTSLVGEKRWNDRLLQHLGITEVDTDIDYWAGNIVLGRHSKTRTYALITSLPISEHRSRIYVVTMQEKHQGHIVKRGLNWLRFQLSRPLITAFIRQDEKALEGVRFNPTISRHRPDNTVNRWLAHVDKLPSTTIDKILS